MMELGYEVVWPRSKRIIESTRHAQRLSTLEGKTVCELWDWIFRGNEIFPVLEEELAKRYPGIKFVNYKEFGSTHGREESEVLATLTDKLRQNKCDAVISGIGC